MTTLGAIIATIGMIGTTIGIILVVTSLTPTYYPKTIKGRENQGELGSNLITIFVIVTIIGALLSNI